jgi:uncharacterized coiled-coil DUF342 family protein
MTSVTPIRHSTDAAFATLENELTESIRNLAPSAKPLVTDAPSASYQEDIGKLSAEAVLEQYKMAAKSVEEMGSEVTKRIAALEAALNECHSDMKLIKEAADAIAAKGKLAHAEIERTAAVSSDIRAIVAQIMAKLT